MVPSSGVTPDATYGLAAECLQLQEFAKQLQVHFEVMEQELFPDSPQEQQSQMCLTCLNEIQDQVRRIEEHVDQMRGQSLF